MPLAFEHLNLRWNPFGEPPTNERASLFIGDIQSLSARLRPGVALQLVGAHGRGKSSRLLALQRTLGAPYVRLRDQHAFPVAPIVLLDEGELLWKRTWWRLPRCGAVAISTHRNLALVLRGMGFTVQTERVSEVSADTLARIFAARIEWARRAPGPVPTLSPRTISTLQARFGDDIRGMEGELYAIFQQLSGVGIVEV